MTSRGNPKKASRLLYLACPYTHPDPSIRKMRFDAATSAAAALIKLGYVVYSPITMTHPIDLVLAGQENTLGSDYWVEFDETFMDRCDEIVVLEIDGWRQSSGVQREIQHFLENGKPIWSLSADLEIKDYETVAAV
ncbi:MULTISPECIES: DUF1937 family protein [unclassified Mesorhizobium]|uniref:DUF1937 family protein n=1 Tax=unclassified Mesorhizobium TaxID=325217 RepID=UPI000FD216D3|nr:MULTISPECIES: DUF1937 family protein [unclassified Mesorhizobium]RUV15061.1 DUF1937 family protein [Mesorhizobium sp. M5C.F.Ca.IN.020.32.2.1]RWL05507.1 MAG: DUF1937 family protein [Mesorhizobium sp.]